MIQIIKYFMYPFDFLVKYLLALLLGLALIMPTFGLSMTSDQAFLENLSKATHRYQPTINPTNCACEKLSIATIYYLSEMGYESYLMKSEDKSHAWVAAKNPKDGRYAFIESTWGGYVLPTRLIDSQYSGSIVSDLSDYLANRGKTPADYAIYLKSSTEPYHGPEVTYSSLVDVINDKIEAKPKRPSPQARYEKLAKSLDKKNL